MAYIFVNGGKKYQKSRRKRTKKNRKKRKKVRDKRRKIDARSQRISRERSTVTLQGPGVKKWKAASIQPCNRMPLIVFGDAMFGGPKHCIKLRGKQPGVVKRSLESASTS